MSGEAFDRIMGGLGEALAHAQGDAVPGVRVRAANPIDVASIRKRTGLTQAAFSDRIGVSLALVRHWELGRRAPVGPARVLLALIDKHPAIVQAAGIDLA